MERVFFRYLSHVPVSAFLWTDLSPANVVVAAVAVITSHVIELARRSGVLEMIGVAPVRKSGRGGKDAHAARATRFAALDRV